MTYEPICDKYIRSAAAAARASTLHDKGGASGVWQCYGDGLKCSMGATCNEDNMLVAGQGR